MQIEAGKMREQLQELNGLKKSKKVRKMIQSALQEYEIKQGEWNSNFRVLEEAGNQAISEVRKLLENTEAKGEEQERHELPTHKESNFTQ